MLTYAIFGYPHSLRSRCQTETDCGLWGGGSLAFVVPPPDDVADGGAASARACWPPATRHEPLLFAKVRSRHRLWASNIGRPMAGAVIRAGLDFMSIMQFPFPLWQLKRHHSKVD
jgi:hypothetical protein